jgi:hypothetical protein
VTTRCHLLKKSLHVFSASCTLQLSRTHNREQTEQQPRYKAMSSYSSPKKENHLCFELIGNLISTYRNGYTTRGMTIQGKKSALGPRRVQKLIQAQRLLFQQVDIQFSVTKQNYESVLRARTLAAYYIGADDVSRFTMSIIMHHEAQKFFR